MTKNSYNFFSIKDEGVGYMFYTASGNWASIFSSLENRITFLFRLLALKTQYFPEVKKRY